MAQDLPLDSRDNDQGNKPIDSNSLNRVLSSEHSLTSPTPKADTVTVATPTPSPSPLAEKLAEQLGITSDQGAAGAGSILRYAKQKMGADDFQKISEFIPGMDHILTVGPSVNTSGLAENVAAIESDNPGVATMLLINDFDQIGMAPDMVEKFIPIIVHYVKTQGGESGAGMLKNALAGI